MLMIFFQASFGKVGLEVCVQFERWRRKVVVMLYWWWWKRITEVVFLHEVCVWKGIRRGWEVNLCELNTSGGGGWRKFKFWIMLGVGRGRIWEAFPSVYWVAVNKTAPIHDYLQRVMEYVVWDVGRRSILGGGRAFDPRGKYLWLVAERDW